MLMLWMVVAMYGIQITTKSVSVFGSAVGLIMTVVGVTGACIGYENLKGKVRDLESKLHTLVKGRMVSDILNTLERATEQKGDETVR